MSYSALFCLGLPEGSAGTVVFTQRLVEERIFEVCKGKIDNIWKDKELRTMWNWHRRGVELEAYQP